MTKKSSAIAVSDYIEVKGARANNLKGIDIRIPRGSFAVVTGVSGSGKSSLAFDTLYAEGRRRYVESLSSYARQFLGRIPKPECDFIKGLPPAIAIEQKVGSHNPRSTVGTATELNDYLRMLFARIGHTFSPESGREVRKESPEMVVDNLMRLAPGTRIAVTAPIHLPEGRLFSQQLEIYLQEGYSRLERDGEFIDIREAMESDTPMAPEFYNLLIDRLSIENDDDTRSRLTDSVETAYFEGRDEMSVRIYGDYPEVRHFDRRFRVDGIDFREPSDLMFNFNNPYGACEVCEGFGSVMGISEDLVVPDKSLSVFQGAVVCWKGEKMDEWRRWLIENATAIGFPIHKPYQDLTRQEHDILWHGKGSWEGIDGFFRWVDSNQYKIQYRVMKARFRGKTPCPHCGGTRLKPDVQYVKVGEKSFTDLLDMPISRLRAWFETLDLSDTDAQIAHRLLREINSRLRYLDDVGLGYLTLSRPWGTLSGGESQRIKLATALGSSLVGSLYVLDEPSIGLHPRDTRRLLSVLKNLRDLGNTLLVVEHDEEIMRSADWIADIGPGAGSMGGKLLFSGTLAEALDSSVEPGQSRTLRFLRGQEKISVPQLRRPWNKRITIQGASANNLKNIDVDFPLGVFTVVTGVSGSGKSTLVRDILYRALASHLGASDGRPGVFRKLSGDVGDLKGVEFVDQNPVGTSTRSNAATYLKIFDDIRRLYADQPLARQLGMTPGFFSFNTEGGRCEECKGEGKITIPMQFMADISVPCPECGGKRFGTQVLEVTYHDKTISDVLDMTVSDALEFFSTDPSDKTARRIVSSLQPLIDVGLGYLPLGQPSSTLSGGENQRLKLAWFLSNVSSHGHTLFILDDPTTGLHTADIATLLESLRKLIDKGNTVVVIEHNMHVAKSADHIIDLGPEGGEEGGTLVASGTPEQVAECSVSLTGKALKDVL